MIRYITNLFKQMSFGRKDLKAFLYKKKNYSHLKRLFSLENLMTFFWGKGFFLNKG